jgi:hypothetical protein
MDGDGDLDLFIGGLFGDPSLIFANNADGTFVDVTAGSGIDGLTADFNISAAFGDYDLDGDLDLFVGHWGVQKLPGRIGDTEHLWRNDSDATGIYFVSVSIESGIAASILTDVPDANGKIFDSTFTPTFARINDDRFPDLLSVADHGQTRYFLNNGDGTFTNATDPNVITDDFGMGSAVGDFDNDGDLDWFVTSIYRSDSADFSGNRLYRNDAGTFADATPGSGTRAGGWGWGACAIDFENDGLLDIYHTNGWHTEPRFEFDVSRAFTALGGLRFRNNTASLGLDDNQQGRGVVCADFDNDGDIDIFQQHRHAYRAATLWRNDQTANNYLKVRLIGRAPNTEAAGARIYASIGTTTQMREIMIGSNFLSQNPATQHFGLGPSSQVDELKIEWPDGTEEVLTAVAAGQLLTVEQAAL